MKRSTLFLLLIAIVLSFISRTVSSEEARPIIPKTMNERVEMIAVGGGWLKLELETTFFVPPGTGPFPLVVINHGKASGNPRFDSRARYLAASREFLRRGYLVALPMRPGFSKSGGGYIEARCNIESNGYLQAETLIDFLGEITKRPEIDPSRILIIGQSHGGLTAMALGAKGFPGVLGILNFAGGYRYTGDSCIWAKSLVDAFESYGKTTRIPSLWFYGDNDSYWGKDLPKKMHSAYQAAGGNAHLVSFGTFAKGDAHSMFSNADGAAIWWPETEIFLRKIGLPTDLRFELETVRRPPRTNFAALEDADAVPYLDERRRALYREFLAMPHPRAFSIASTGNVGWAYQGHDPLARSLDNCERLAKTPCTLYAIDNDVVWQPDRGSNTR